MTFSQLQAEAIKAYYPALFLENFWPRGRGKHLLQALRLFWGIILVAAVTVYGLSRNQMPELDRYVPIAFGAFCIVFAFWMLAGAIHAFYNFYYFKSLPEGHAGEMPKMSFELGRMLYQSTSRDILKGFLESDEGFATMIRTGISVEEVGKFIAARKNVIQDDMVQVADAEYISASDYVSALLDADTEFTQFLFSHGIQKKDFLMIVEWVAERAVAERARMRWWSKDRLGRIPGIGKGWSYGQTFMVEKYARSIPFLEGGEYEVHHVYGSKELKELEAVLVRDRAANALVVSDDKEGSLHLIARLNRMIDDGTAMAQLQHKRLILLDAELMVSSLKSKSDFETIVLKVLQEALHAGNIILVFSDFSSFIHSAEAFDVDIAPLMDPYLSSPGLHVIALSDTSHFHTRIEPNIALMERFEHIYIHEVDAANTVRVLQNELIPMERSTGVLFSFPALIDVATSAERYFPEGIMPDKAISLMSELVSRAVAKHSRMILKEDVQELIKIKTGIPVGKVTSDEREKLLNLEGILHQRIIGQDEAVTAIANAVRRARSGINNPNRPLASFLFLGPTGVGKTETTKALGEIFFGKDTQILRIDMSEYSSPDALSKLIGSFAAGKSGVLATILREHPFGVLLLDEFEKTTPEVMNLFLQVLDEGFFSDMEGKKINARNLLIIATSNAGSDMIWDAVKHGEHLDHAKELIIDNIIKSHVMKPELLNRFDGVIVFHPLGNEHLRSIARLQLETLKKRLAERGINLAITDDLVSYLMQYGTDPKFGARPMNRAIQDKIEQVIAEKMIRGDIIQGQEVALLSQDLK